MTSSQGRNLVVRARRQVALDVVELCLADPAGELLADWTPGTHIELVLRPDLARQYSLCGSPRQRDCWTIAALRERDGRGGSEFVHSQLRVGSAVAVRALRNQFPFERAPAYVFIAGGIGITPLRPMIAEAEQCGADWRLVYGGRTRAAMAYADELAESYGGRVTIAPQDETGLLDLPVALGAPAPGTLVYSCGPEGLLTAVEAACRGWPAGALRTERFTAGQAAATGSDVPFGVELARDGRFIRIPADATILQTLEAAGVDVLSSCREGICGTCETGVIAGAVDHRDFYLTDDERAAGHTMMICVSRAAGSRLVLDL